LRISYSNGVVFTNICKTLLIMELTGKCFEDFLSFFNSKRRGTEVSFYQLPELFQNALTIEFFDSVGILIEIQLIGSNMFGFDIHTESIFEDQNVYKTRTEAINSAFEKANETYNQNK